MWLGVLWTGDDDEQVLLAYWPDRIVVAAGPLGGLARMALVFRHAATEAGDLAQLPRCAHCGADLGIPDIDAFDEGWAACASS